MNRLKSYLINNRFYKYLSYLKNRKSTEQRKQYFRAEAVDILRRFADTLNEHNILFWLDFGTLLGYYREHDFIGHDFDLDFGAKLEDAAMIRECLLAAGFTLMKEYHVEKAIEESYRWGHTSIDVFYYQNTPDNNSLFCYSFRHFDKVTQKDVRKKMAVGVETFTVPQMGFVRAEFKGCNVFVPEKTEEYLIANYGSDYMIPNPNFNWLKDAPNIKVFSYEEKPGWAIFYEIMN